MWGQTEIHKKCKLKERVNWRGRFEINLNYYKSHEGLLGVGLLAGHSSCAIFCCTLPEGPADNSSGLAMTSSWRRTFGNVCSFVNNSMGGLRGGANLASWVVAGTLAYFLWVKPAQDLKREQEVVSSRLSCVSVLPFPFNRVS